jgi:hypothetical protein
VSNLSDEVDARDPFFYPVSERKLWIMGVGTLGLYPYYLDYQNWRQLATRSKGIWPPVYVPCLLRDFLCWQSCFFTFCSCVLRISHVCAPRLAFLSPISCYWLYRRMAFTMASTLGDCFSRF